MISAEKTVEIIQQLELIYGYQVNVKVKINPKSRIRASYNPTTNTIIIYNPIITTPYHEYGHALYAHLKRQGITFNLPGSDKQKSEIFAQRFSTMWLNLERTGFRCTCGSRAFIPAHNKGKFEFTDIGLYCLKCGRTYALANKKELMLHYNP